MDRFFIDNIIQTNSQVIISGEDAHHIIRTLRLRVGEKLEIATPKGAYIAELIDIINGRRDAVVKILEEIKYSNEPKTYIRLFQGLPKGQKLDLIVQKATEVGISEIIPVEMHRSVAKRPKNEKIERYQKIAREAAMQSKRDIIPKVHKAINFSDIEECISEDESIFVPYEEEEILSIKEVLCNMERPKLINLFIGPEGGFEKSEIEKLKSLGGKIFSLGNRILRTETAGIICSSVIFYEYGDLDRR